MNRYNFSAKTLDEAITKACVELGVTSDMLDYSIVEQGSNGVLGIGARPWVISAGNKEEKEAEQEIRHDESFAEVIKENAARSEPLSDTPKEKKGRETASAKTEEKAPIKKKASASCDGAAKEKAEAFLRSVFDSMGLEVFIESEYDEMLCELDINLSGDDMGVLIGKRGQTLDSLQYLAGQVVNKHGGGYVRVKLDTENYRERRKDTLETLAHNMAQKVRRTKRPMALEPMNPYERRIIHSTLQDERDIFTRSEGEEPYRHVVVCYSKHKRQ